jgi:hypothetical protein
MSTLRKVVHDDDLNGLKQFLDSNPGPSQDELDNALLYAADKGHAGAVAEQLLHGARITELALLGAARSQEPAIFKNPWTMDGISTRRDSETRH